jgi:CheY-like chemotaxis protein
VLEAGDGSEALRLAGRRESIHLLLTDVIMPRMSGHELVRRLQSKHPEMRVLFMSGYVDDSIARYGAIPPGVALLQKPFTPDVLVRKVRTVLTSPLTPHAR